MAEQALANIVRVDMITNEDIPQLLQATTDEEITPDPIVNEGKREALRSKNRILAQNNYEDLILGYKLAMKKIVFDVEQFAIIDGGTYTAVADPVGFNYSGPAVGTALSRTGMTLDVWTEEKDGAGETAGYIRWRFPRAKGKPAKFTMKDGGFFAPEYNLITAPLPTEKPILIDWFDALPNGTASELLAAVNVAPEA